MIDIDRSKYLKNEEFRNFLNMVKGEIDKEISSLESSYKKQFTRNQVIKFYQEFYKKIAWNLELEEKFVKK